MQIIAELTNPHSIVAYLPRGRGPAIAGPADSSRPHSSPARVRLRQLNIHPPLTLKGEDRPKQTLWAYRRLAKVPVALF